MNRLFIVEGGKTRVLVNKDFDNESLLQDILEKFPEFVALEDLGVSEPFVVIGREVATPAGYIDVLCIDGEGVLTVIETKLARNPQIRREVVGQVLEYVAQLSKWKAQDVIQVANQYFQSSSDTGGTGGATLTDLLKSTSEPEEMLSPGDVYERIENNLRKGRIKVVIASDAIPETLKDTVNFINSFSNFDIYVLQVQLFKKDDLEIYAPAIFGFARKAGVGTPERRLWNEVTFFDALANIDGIIVQTIREIYEFCKQDAVAIKWGTGKVNGSFSFAAEKEGKVFTVISVWTTEDITVNFGNMKGIIKEEALDAFRLVLNRLPHINFSKEIITEGKYPSFSLNSLQKLEDLETFKTAVRNLLA